MCGRRLFLAYGVLVFLALLAFLAWTDREELASIPTSLLIGTFFGSFTLGAICTLVLKIWLLLHGLKGSRVKREEEAERLIAILSRKPRRRTIFPWRVLDLDLVGRRAVVKPLLLGRFSALIGRNLKTGRPFFITLPPEVREVAQAIEQTYRFEPGSWRGAEREELGEEGEDDHR